MVKIEFFSIYNKYGGLPLIISLKNAEEKIDYLNFQKNDNCL